MVDFDVQDYMRITGLDQGNWDASTISVECAPESTASCFEDRPSDDPIDGSKTLCYGAADIGAGEKLVVTISVTFNIDGCALDSSVEVENDARISAAEGYTMSGSYRDTAYVTLSVPECDSADISIAKEQDQFETNNGDARTYTLTYTNNGTEAVTGINVEDHVSYGAVPIGGATTDFIVTCDAASSAACPSWLAEPLVGDDVEGLEISIFDDKKIDLAAGATLTLNVGVTPNITGCSEAGKARVGNETTIFGPTESGQYLPTEPQRASRMGQVAVAACEQVTLTGAITVEPTESALFEPAVFTVTLTNTGDNDIVGYHINGNSYIQNGSSPSWRIACDEASSECPSWVDPAGTVLGSEPDSRSPLSYVIVDEEEVSLDVDIPANSSLILNVTRAGIDGRASCTDSGKLTHFYDLYQWDNQSTTTSGGQVIASTFSTDALTTLWCGDLVTNTKISSADPEPDSPITVTSTITSAQGIARDAEVKIQLPEGGFDFDPDSEVRCTATGAVTCPTFTYDAATHSVVGTVTEFGATGASLSVEVDGFTGVVPPRAAAYGVSTTVESRGEVDEASNTSTNNFTYANQRTSVPVKLAIAGEADWVGEPVTFAGTLACSGSDDRDLELAFERKTLGAELSLADVWLRDECTVTLTAPEPPAGLSAVAQLSVEVRIIAPTAEPTEPSSVPTLRPNDIAATGATWGGWLVGLSVALLLLGGISLWRRRCT